MICAMKRETLDSIDYRLIKVALAVGACCPIASFFNLQRALDFLLPTFLILMASCCVVGYAAALKERNSHD